jgi:hypothetical protein
MCQDFLLTSLESEPPALKGHCQYAPRVATSELGRYLLLKEHLLFRFKKYFHSRVLPRKRRYRVKQPPVKVWYDMFLTKKNQARLLYAPLVLSIIGQASNVNI